MARVRVARLTAVEVRADILLVGADGAASQHPRHALLPGGVLGTRVKRDRLNLKQPAEKAGHLQWK